MCEGKGLTPGTQEYADCIDECMKGSEPGKGNEERGGSPCEGEGYLGKQMKSGRNYILLQKCREGYSPRKAGDGRIWCCKKTEDKTDEEEGTTDEEGEVGEGCYKLADKPLAPGGGKIWTDDLITAEMGFRRPGNAQGHWLHRGGKWYTLEDVHNAIKNNTLGSLQGREGSACQKGYKRVTKDGEVYCCPDEGGGTGGGGTFEWSPELMEMLTGLQERFKYLLEYPMGYSPEDRQAIINYMVGGIQRGERGEIQSLKDRLARTGLIGQPAAVEQIGELKRGTGEKIAGVRQGLAVDEINKRYQQMLGTTGMASQLFGVTSSIEQLKEALNAGRRSESRDAFSQLMQYLSILMGGGQNSGYWQAIFNSMNQGGGQDIWDLLPYFGYLLT